MASDGNALALSAQEQAIVEGKKVLHGTVTDRVLRLFEAIRAYGPPRVTLERAIHFTESFKTTEGQPLVLRWARALKNIAEKITVAIFDDELIVGRPNTWLGRYSLVYPELDGTIMKAGAEAFIAAKGAPDAITVTEEDKKIIDEVNMNLMEETRMVSPVSHGVLGNMTEHGKNDRFLVRYAT